MKSVFSLSGVFPASLLGTGSLPLAEARMAMLTWFSLHFLPRSRRSAPFPGAYSSSSPRPFPHRGCARGFALYNPIGFPALPIACFASGMARSVRWLGSLSNLS